MKKKYVNMLFKFRPCTSLRVTQLFMFSLRSDSYEDLPKAKLLELACKFGLMKNLKDEKIFDVFEDGDVDQPFVGNLIKIGFKLNSS